MANKSFESSAVAHEEGNVNDPEYAKDFNSAYQKVRKGLELTDDV
jgi:hypothetical protein